MSTVTNEPKHQHPTETAQTQGPQGPQGSQQVMIQPVVMQGGGGAGALQAMMSPVPVRMVCPFCSADMCTNVLLEPGICTWVSCVLIFGSVIGCCGCCLIPFCTDCTKDAIHVCPSCGRQVGVCKRC